METSIPSVDDPGRSFEENLEKYQVYSSLEIGRILRRIKTDKKLIHMSLPGTMETVITSVLDVDMEHKMLVLDMAPVGFRNQIALKGSVISFEGVLDKIKIAFTVDHAFPYTFEGMPALRAPFPDRLVRLQRREHFRVPVFNSTIHIPIEINGQTTYLVNSVYDLSPSGTCVIDVSMMVDVTIGKVYRNCRLELPETQPLFVALEIRNSHRVLGPNNEPRHRIGCLFVDLSSAESALVQRYITRIERMRKKLTDD